MIIVTFVIAAVLLLVALFVKRHAITNREVIAFGLAAILIFLVLSGAINALHAPSFSIHLFGMR